MSAISFGAWGLGRIGSVHLKHVAAQTDMYEAVAGCAGFLAASRAAA